MEKNYIKEMEKVKVTASAQDLWEPAQPGETLENVWVPNRRERRKMLQAKNKKKGMKLLGKALKKPKIMQKLILISNKNYTKHYMKI